MRYLQLIFSMLIFSFNTIAQENYFTTSGELKNDDGSCELTLSWNIHNSEQMPSILDENNNGGYSFNFFAGGEVVANPIQDNKYGFAVSLTPTSYPFDLLKVKMYFSKISLVEQGFYLHIWDESNNNLLPEYFIPAGEVTSTGWWEKDISNYNISINSGKVKIGICQKYLANFIYPPSPPSPPRPVFLGADINSDGNSEIIISGEFQNYSGMDFMIRALGPEIPLETWIGFYNNILNNPDITNSKKLWAGQTNTSPLPPVKICADGSNATLIKFKNNTDIDNEYLKFAVESYSTSNEIDYSGEFSSGDYSYNEDTIIARFTHPTYMDVENLFREDKIQIQDISNNDNIIFEYPIQVYRAPVVMVHGLWGNPSTFTNMKEQLKADVSYIDPLITIVNYEPTNSLSFSANANVIKDEINQAFLWARLYNFSAGKVDIVAHSMGGVLSRLYLQNSICTQNQTTNCYRQDIHKLLTIGTPHSGTQSANLLMSNTVSGMLLRAALNNTYLFGTGKKVQDGAVEDLQVNSDATIVSLNGSSLNQNVVPSHVLISKAVFSDAYSWPLLLEIAAQGAAMTIDEFLSYLYNNVPSDLIVPINSEDAGVNTSFISPFYSQMHLGQASNTDIISEIKIALNLNPNNNTYFTDSGFNPPTLESHYNSDKIAIIPPALADGSIDIISPNIGDSFNAGDVVQVSVSGSSNISKIILTAYSASFDNDIFLTDTTVLSSAIFNYQIPTDSYGFANIMVFGFDSEGFVAYDSLSINVSTTANLDSITTDPQSLLMAMGQKKSISLTGYFDDGIQRNLCYMNGIQYSVLDTTIVKHISLNIIEGKNIGTTILTISYQTQTIDIPIEVFYAENWVTGIIENPYWGEFNNKSIIQGVKVYPNPSTNIATIDYELLENAFVKLELFNTLGNKMLVEINEKQLKDKYSYQINLGDLNTGVYYYILTANNSNQTGKLIIMK